MISQTQVLGGGQPCWLIDATKPYAGSTQSYLLPDGTVAYSGGMTWEEYATDRKMTLQLVTSAELDALDVAFVAGIVTEPAPITEEQWEYALNVLPPCRWCTERGVQLFHVSERIMNDLVHWYGRIGDNLFSFTDQARRPIAELADKVAGAMLAAD